MSKQEIEKATDQLLEQDLPTPEEGDWGGGSIVIEVDVLLDRIPQPLQYAIEQEIKEEAEASGVEFEYKQSRYTAIFRSIARLAFRTRGGEAAGKFRSSLDALESMWQQELSLDTPPRHLWFYTMFDRKALRDITL